MKVSVKNDGVENEKQTDRYPSGFKISKATNPCVARADLGWRSLLLLLVVEHAAAALA